VSQVRGTGVQVQEGLLDDAFEVRELVFHELGLSEGERRVVYVGDLANRDETAGSNAASLDALLGVGVDE